MQFFNRVTDQDRADFAKNLSVMLKSGITIDEALLSLANQSPSRALARATARSHERIEQGELLSSAFASEERAFGSLFVHLVKAGETSGTLSDNLEFLAQWYERSADLHREVSAATLYPKLVFAASILLGGSLAVFILPRLVPLFAQLDAELPLITKAILVIAVFLKDWWLWCIIFAILLVIAMRLLLRIPAVSYAIHFLQVRLPFIGHMFRAYQLALMAQLYTTLLRSGIPITEATRIVESTLSNACYRSSFAALGAHIDAGNTLSDGLRDDPRLFPPLLVSIVRVGEHSGTLTESFGYLSGYYEKEVRSTAKKIPTIVEPVLLVFIAAVVGLVALSIILPIYEITGSINR